MTFSVPGFGGAEAAVVAGALGLAEAAASGLAEALADGLGEAAALAGLVFAATDAGGALDTGAAAPPQPAKLKLKARIASSLWVLMARHCPLSALSASSAPEQVRPPTRPS